MYQFATPKDSSIPTSTKIGMYTRRLHDIDYQTQSKTTSTHTELPISLSIAISITSILITTPRPQWFSPNHSPCSNLRLTHNPPTDRPTGSSIWHNVTPRTRGACRTSNRHRHGIQGPSVRRVSHHWISRSYRRRIIGTSWSSWVGRIIIDMVTSTTSRTTGEEGTQVGAATLISSGGCFAGGVLWTR
jgi:hypothetical protein